MHHLVVEKIRSFKIGIFQISPIEGTGHLDLLDCIANVSDHKVSDCENRKHLNMLNPKQLF